MFKKTLTALVCHSVSKKEEIRTNFVHLDFLKNFDSISTYVEKGLTFFKKSPKRLLLAGSSGLRQLRPARRRRFGGFDECYLLVDSTHSWLKRDKNVTFKS